MKQVFIERRSLYTAGLLKHCTDLPQVVGKPVKDPKKPATFGQQWTVEEQVRSSHDPLRLVTWSSHMIFVSGQIWGVIEDLSSWASGEKEVPENCPGSRYQDNPAGSPVLTTPLALPSRQFSPSPSQQVSPVSWLVLVLFWCAVLYVHGRPPLELSFGDLWNVLFMGRSHSSKV